MKSFFESTLDVFTEEITEPTTFRQMGFICHIQKIRQIFHEIETSKKKEKEENLRILLAETSEPALQTLVLAENTYWYRKFLKAKMPKTYDRYEVLKNIDDFDPPLLYESFIRADSGKFVNPLEEFLVSIFSTIRWTTTTTYKLTQIFNGSLRTMHLINKFDEINTPSSVDFLAKQFLEATKELMIRDGRL